VYFVVHGKIQDDIQKYNTNHALTCFNNVIWDRNLYLWRLCGNVCLRHFLDWWMVIYKPRAL